MTKAKPHGLRDFLRTAYIWIGTGGLVLAFFPVIAIVRLFDRDPVLPKTGRILRRVGVLSSRINPTWDIHVEGSEKIDRDQTYVIVANHQSMSDIPIISNIPIPFKWVAAEWVFSIPVLGWMMRMAGNIPVRLKKGSNKKEVIEKATTYLHQGCSVMFFPEGRRSIDGQLHRFKNGAFELAIQTGCPVLPVAIDGLWDFLPLKSLIFNRPRDFQIKVLDPINADHLTEKDSAYLREKARFMIMQQLASWRECDLDQVDSLVFKDQAIPA